MIESKPSQAEVLQAWEAHRTMQIILGSTPHLRDNPFFMALADTASARFQEHYRKWAKK